MQAHGARLSATVLALGVVVLTSGAAQAAEYDPYWGWRAPPRDATRKLDRALNGLLVQGLSDVNAQRPATCREAARVLTRPLVVTSSHFFRSEMRRWTMDRTPRDERERRIFDEVSVYRDTPLFPFGHFVPLDPTLQVDGVLFGPDKIGHFFTNGRRAWERFLDARDRGVGEGEALRQGLRYGVAEEKGWLGFGIDGVFSFADLHAMSAGIRWFRALCEGGQLTRGDDGRWTYAPLFSLADWIDPCWDESFATSAFTEREADNVEQALLEVCPLLDEPAVRARREDYRARGCHAPTQATLDALVASGEAPSPARWDIDRVCATDTRSLAGPGSPAASPPPSSTPSR